MNRIFPYLGLYFSEQPPFSHDFNHITLDSYSLVSQQDYIKKDRRQGTYTQQELQKHPLQTRYQQPI